MKEAVNFLVQVFNGSMRNLANILTAEANGNRETIITYLEWIKNKTEELIEKVKNNE